MAYEPDVYVTCGECGARYLTAARIARYWRKRERSPKCPDCRRLGYVVLTEEERETYRRFWLEESGLSRRELVSIAQGLVLG